MILTGITQIVDSLEEASPLGRKGLGSHGGVPMWAAAAAGMSSILPLTPPLALGIWLKTLLLNDALQKVSGKSRSLHFPMDKSLLKE